MPRAENGRSQDRRRTQGSGSIQEVAPGKYRLRVFVGTDPVTGSPRQTTLTVQAKSQRQAQQILDSLQEDVTRWEPTGSTATVRTLIDKWMEHSNARVAPPRPSMRPAGRRGRSSSPP
jgi:hypothetical protein